MDIDLVFSGSGTLFPCHIGAYKALLRRGQTPARVAGTSGGAIVAAGISLGYSPGRLSWLSKQAFASGLLDPSVAAWAGYGLNRGNKIRAILGKYLPGRMGDTKIPLRIYAADLRTGAPVVFSTEGTPDVLIADAVRASMSIPFFFSVAAVMPHWPRLVDGGTLVNFAHDAFDDSDRPTVGVRFLADDKPMEIRGVTDVVKALVRMWLKAANTSHISRKHYSNIITVRSAGDWLDFNPDVGRLIAEGEAAVGDDDRT